MGICLNSKMPFDNYAKMAASAYFVDKSLLLQELIPIVDAGGINHVEVLFCPWR